MTWAEPEDRDVLALVESRAEMHRQRVALSVRQGPDFRTTTYGALDAAIHRVSDHLLARGVAAGDRLVLAAPAGPDWVVAFFAAIRAGFTVVPVDPSLPPADLTLVLEETEPAALIATPQIAAWAASRRSGLPSLHEMIVSTPAESDRAFPQLQPVPPREAAERRPEETALIVYTSGTTSRPRGVMISFASLLFEVRRLLERLPLAADDVFLSVLPPHHLLELTCGLMCVLWSGAEVCFARTLLPYELVELMQSRGVTRLVGVPMILRMLRAEMERRRQRETGGGLRLRSLVCGGAPLEGEVAELFHDHGIPVYEGYGLTECSPVIAVNGPGALRTGTVGRPLRGVEVRIDGAGEILTRGPHVMQGYLGPPELTAGIIDHEGWLHTGDLGHLDAEGFLRVSGRLKDLIVLPTGKKVSPEEVEAALAGSPLFREVCVVAAPDPAGEQVCVVVVPGEALRGLDSQEASSAAREEVARRTAGLAAHKRPSHVIVYPNPLPRTASQKVRRREVAERVRG